MSSLFPEGLSEEEFKLLTDYSNQVKDIPLKNLISIADEYLKQVHSAYLKNGFINYPRKQWAHKLGNLILLGRRKNTAQGRLDFNLKKAKYFKDTINLFPNSLRVINNYHEWGPDQVQDNHNIVISKLKEHYIER